MAYTALILNGAGDYDSVRNLLGVTSDDVADATINDTPFLPSVEAEITSAITGYAALTGANSTRLKTGAACWTAALLCGYLTGVQADAASDLGFTVGAYSEKVGSSAGVDYATLASDLRVRAAEALAGISTRTWTRPSLMKFGGRTNRADEGLPESLEEWLDLITPPILEEDEGDG